MSVRPECIPIRRGWTNGQRVNGDAIVLVHGGPVSEPEDVAFLKNTKNCHGFYDECPRCAR